MDCPITHLFMHSLSLTRACTHTHTAEDMTTITEQFPNFCNLCKLDQNSSMLSVMIMEHDTENIMLVRPPLSFRFHHLYVR